MTLPPDPIDPDPIDPEEPAEPLPRVELTEDLPEVVSSERDLVQAAQRLATGTGPIAIDAERASGFRYGQRAYLVQLRRAGAGTLLIDPMACPDLGPLNEAIGDAEWILHAATQDIPCLAAVGMRPTTLFDTELAGRLAGLPRVGLGAMVEHYLGHSLAKEHSAADWSTRPLPRPWLVYAALDVEVLLELRHAVADDLVRQDKWEWARQEFEALLTFDGPPTRTDPWRRTSGIHKVRKRRVLANVRELWLERDDLAAARDVSPRRVLPDAALILIALGGPAAFAPSRPAMGAPRGLGGADPAPLVVPKSARRHQRNWLRALERAAAVPEAELPPLTLPSVGPPPPRLWAERDPQAAARLDAVRAELTAYATHHSVPLENLVVPDTLRRLLWQAEWEPTEAAIDDALARLGARPWQRAIVVPAVLRAVSGPDVRD